MYSKRSLRVLCLLKTSGVVLHRTCAETAPQGLPKKAFGVSVIPGRTKKPSSGVEDIMAVGERGDDQRFRQNPWKLKQKRFARHIINLVKKSQQTEAVKVLEQMKSAKVKPDAVVYNSILAGYGKQGDVKKAFKTFNEMKKRALLPTDHTYTSMFAACGMAGPVASPILDKVQAEMERRDVFPNTIVTNALIAALAQCGRHDDALQAYLNMSKQNLLPDLFTFGSLLVAMAKDKHRGLELAQRVWSEMRASGLEADLHSFNMVLQVLRDAGLDGVVMEAGQRKLHTETILLDKEEEVDEKRRTSSKITLFVQGKAGFTLSDDVTLSMSVGSISPRGPPTLRWLDRASVECFYAALKQRRLKPDIHTFHLLVHLTLDPSHLLKTMEERKVKADGKFMTAAITQQATQLQNLRGAKVLWKYSKSKGLNLGQMGYQALASSCRQQKDGLELLKTMQESGVSPNEYVMGTLIGHAARDHNYEYLTALVRVMMQQHFVPNQTILQMMETAATHDVKSFHQKKRQNGYKGFYTIWKRTALQNNEHHPEEDDYVLDID